LQFDEEKSIVNYKIILQHPIMVTVVNIVIDIDDAGVYLCQGVKDCLDVKDFLHCL
jgi:hypothetical protein